MPLNIPGWESRHRVKWGAVTAAFCVAGLACNTLQGSSASPTPGPTAVETATAVPIIEGFDGTDESFRSLHGALESDPEGLILQAQAALGSSEIETRFAAVYALGLAVDEANAGLLLPALRDPDLALRMIAAGALIGLGEPESIPILIAAMDTDDLLPHSHPPRPMWMFADATLRWYTRIDFGLTADAEDQRQASAEAWRNWWEENGASLTWDGEAWTVQP